MLAKNKMKCVGTVILNSGTTRIYFRGGSCELKKNNFQVFGGEEWVRFSKV